MNLISRLLSRGSLITLFRYALAALGGVLAEAGNMDLGQWETISGAILVVVVALMGGSDSGVDKVTIAGKTVAKEALPAEVQRKLDVAVSVTKKRSFLDILFGK